MAGIHGLQHVQGFWPADFAHHNPIRAHTQTVDQQFPLPHGAVAFQIRRPGFQPGDMGLLQS